MKLFKAFLLLSTIFILTGTSWAQAPDPSKWIVWNAKAGLNGQQECYATPNVNVTGGNLTILTTATTTTCGTSSASYGSGALYSNPFSFTFGTVEFSAKMPGGTGPWPAIWMLGTNCRLTNPLVYNGCSSWPAAGSDEIDITEILGSNLTSVNQQVHTTGGSPGCTASTSNVSAGFHTYAFAWNSSSEKWYIDGALTCTITTNISTTAKFLIINTAVGGCCGGTPNNATFPQTMSVAYIRVCSAVGTSCSQANANLFDDEFSGTSSPNISGLSATSGPIGATVTISGTGFGSTQLTSTVKFNGTTATASAWSDTSITTTVPSGATTGSVIVNVGGTNSNGQTFTVTGTPTFIQSQTVFSSASGTVPLTTTSPIGAGHLILVLVRGDQSGTFGQAVTDSAGSTYTPVTGSNVGPNGQFFYTQNSGSGGGSTLTVTGANTNTSVTMAEYSGMSLTGGPACVGTGSSGSTTGMTTGSCTTIAASTLVVGGFAVNGGPTFSAGTDGQGHAMTARTTGTTAANIEDIFESSAAAYGATASLGTAQGWVGQTIAFNASGSSGTSPNISGLSVSAGPVGTPVTITGSNFGTTQGMSSVTFTSGKTATITSWSATSISVTVPTGAVTGNVIVTVSSVASNGVLFTVGSVSVAATVTDSLTRVPQTGTPPSGTSISLTAGRGESVSSQIIVSPPTNTTVVGLTATALSGPGGATIPSSAFVFYREFYSTIVGTAGVPGTGTNQPGGSGVYAEPLIPFVDPETGLALYNVSHAINAANFAVTGGQNQPYWIDINIPRGSVTVPPGTYTATITVNTSAGNISIPVAVNVLNLELSLIPTEQSQFQSWQPWGVINSDTTGDDYPTLAKALLRNKVMPWYDQPASNAPSDITNLGLNRSGLDWYNYSESSTCGTWPTPIATSANLTSSASNFPSGLPLSLYIGDELNGCTGAGLTYLQTIATNAHGATPPVKTIATFNTAPISGLVGSVDHWVVLVSREQWPALPWSTAGDLWSYGSCDNGNGNTPGYNIDYSPINMRQVAGFTLYSMGGVGTLYYRSDGWIQGNTAAEYSNPNSPMPCSTGSGPGDGVMVYPAGPIGSTEPAPGIRLKAFRDALQDWEVANMLKNLGGGAFVTATLSGGVATTWTNWTKNSTTLINAHNSIEAQISTINTPVTTTNIPRVYYLDLVSGPVGTILTIGGNNFGSSQLTSTVKVNGVSASTVYTWTNTKIQFAVPALATSGTVVVTVGGATSICENHDDGCSFTVRAGSIFYVSPTGSDTTGTGTFAAPWATIPHALPSVVAGSILYIQNGYIMTAPDGTGWHAALLLSTGHGANQGTAANPIALVAYPGATVTIGSLTAQSGSGDTTQYGLRTDGTTSYYTISGITLRGPACASSVTGGSGWRYINNDVRATDTGSQQCGAADFENLTTSYTYGNNLHDSGSQNKQGHTVYFTTNTNSVFFGWNQIVNNLTCYDVQFHSSGGNDQFDIHVHDNYFTGNRCAGLNFATVDPSKGVVEAYNNVFFHVGNGPLPIDGDTDQACIYAAGILNAGTAPTGSVQIYNNTMYDCASIKSGVFGVVLIANQGSGTNIKYNFTNNIIVPTTAVGVYFAFDTTTSAQVTCSGGNLFFNGGATPSYCPVGAINANPQFISTTTPNLNLQSSSPAIGAGISAHVPTYDYNGLTRPSPPSIGAYEFVGAQQATGTPLAPLLTLLFSK